MANQLAMGGHFVGRMLMTEQEQEESAFDVGGRMSQVFSGAFFACLAIYMVTSSSKSLKVIQASDFETRLKCCCHINIMIATISAFMNFFQLTEVDNYMLPGQSSVVVDVCRPIEWILTCPLMQLSLVIMGGNKIPGYRRYLMPTLAAVVLFFGASTLFVEDTASRICLFLAGMFTHMIAMSFNRRQIMEHSDGEEGLFSGDSEYRKAVLILMMTWFPFPIWFFLSPEGVGIINNLVTVQMGWAFLNILAKSTFMFTIHRFRDNYYYHMQVAAFKRAMKIQGKGQDGFDDKAVHDERDDSGEPMPPGAIMPEASERNEGGARYFSNEGAQPHGVASKQLEELEKRLGKNFETIHLAMQNQQAQKVESDQQAQKDLADLFDRSQEVIRDRVNCGLADIEKKIDKVHWLTQTSNNMLEVKVETSFETHFKTQQSEQAQIHSMLENLPGLLAKNITEMHSANTSALGAMQQSIQQSLGETQQTMEELQAIQRKVYDMIAGGDLTDMKDTWAAHIVLETKNAAFETQTKIGAVELTANKRHVEGMENISKQLELLVNEGMKKMGSAVMQTTLKSTEELTASIDALQTSHRTESAKRGQEQQILTQQIQDVSQDAVKHAEAGIGAFGNFGDSLRAQLQVLQSQQGEYESEMGSKSDGLMPAIQKELQSQVNQMHQNLESMIQENMVGVFKELKGHMEEESRSQQGRHQDISAVVNTVLEQSRGAADECAVSLARLNTNLSTQGNYDAHMPPHQLGPAQDGATQSTQYNDGFSESGGSKHRNGGVSGAVTPPRSGAVTPTRATREEFGGSFQGPRGLFVEAALANNMIKSGPGQVTSPREPNSSPNAKKRFHG